MITVTTRRVFLFLILVPVTIVFIYFLQARSFYRENFSKRLYLRGLFLEDTEYNREKVRAYRPALNILGDGWNIYWTTEDGVIFEADRMVGLQSRLLYAGTEDDLEAFLQADSIETRKLYESLGLGMEQAEQRSAGQPEKRRVSIDSAD